MNDNLICKLTEYTPFNEEEAADKASMLKMLSIYDDIYDRSNTTCHVTASAWVVNKDRTKVLMAYHNIYNSWAWLGGHADGMTDLLSVAVKEVKEESGLSEVTPVSDEIYSVEILTVDGHVKRGRYVSCHLHLNVTYLLEADDTLPVHNKPDENKAVAWFPIEEALSHSTEPWIRDHIYAKLNAKLAKFK